MNEEDLAKLLSGILQIIETLNNTNQLQSRMNEAILRIALMSGGHDADAIIQAAAEVPASAAG
jgi:hypothetical protein